MGEGTVPRLATRTAFAFNESVCFAFGDETTLRLGRNLRLLFMGALSWALPTPDRGALPPVPPPETEFQDFQSMPRDALAFCGAEHFAFGDKTASRLSRNLWLLLVGPFLWALPTPDKGFTLITHQKLSFWTSNRRELRSLFMGRFRFRGLCPHPIRVLPL